MRMHAENLSACLDIAIKSQREYERNELGYTRYSGLFGGWVQIAEALERGERIEIESTKSSALAWQ